jgi:hypothetical protein
MSRYEQRQWREKIEALPAFRQGIYLAQRAEELDLLLRIQVKFEAYAATALPTPQLSWHTTLLCTCGAERAIYPGPATIIHCAAVEGKQLATRKRKEGFVVCLEPQAELLQPPAPVEGKGDPAFDYRINPWIAPTARQVALLEAADAKAAAAAAATRAAAAATRAAAAAAAPATLLQPRKKGSSSRIMSTSGDGGTLFNRTQRPRTMHTNSADCELVLLVVCL